MHTVSGTRATTGSRRIIESTVVGELNASGATTLQRSGGHRHHMSGPSIRLCSAVPGFFEQRFQPSLDLHRVLLRQVAELLRLFKCSYRTQLACAVNAGIRSILCILTLPVSQGKAAAKPTCRMELSRFKRSEGSAPPLEAANHCSCKGNSQMHIMSTVPLPRPLRQSICRADLLRPGA